MSSSSTAGVCFLTTTWSGNKLMENKNYMTLLTSTLSIKDDTAVRRMAEDIERKIQDRNQIVRIAFQRQPKPIDDVSSPFDLEIYFRIF